MARPIWSDWNQNAVQSVNAPRNLQHPDQEQPS
jgi:hypothetical protein